MKTVALKKLCVSTLVLILAACSPTAVNVAPAPTVAAAISTDTPLPATLPTDTPPPTITPEPVTSAPSFAAATYRDETAGFEFDYPADWTLDPSSQIGARGAQALLLSPGTTLEALADPAIQKRFTELGLDVAPRAQQTPEGLAAFQKAEIDKWWPIIRAAGIKVD